MKTLTCKRSELAYWADVFQSCGGVERNPQEDRDTFKKFIYAVGRNYERVVQAAKPLQDIINKMTAPKSAYNAYLSELESLNAEYAMKDKDGNATRKVKPDGTEVYVFTDESRKIRDGLAGELNKKHAAAIEEYKKQLDSVNKWMEEPDAVEIELFTVPWDWMPERINGAYQAPCSVMCTDIPADIQEMIDATPFRFVDESEKET